MKKDNDQKKTKENSAEQAERILIKFMSLSDEKKEIALKEADKILKEK